MSNKTNVRDPIHNYIYMTDVEESVVRHPLFQRLRYISQNGAAYYTYPSNRHDRFLHSLGVMKIGGDIFLNATEDLLDVDVQSFLKHAYQFIKRVSGNIGVTVAEVTEDYIGKKNQTFLKYGLSIDDDVMLIRRELGNEDSNIVFRFSRAVIFQSLRLACLLHDVGHFPYSHTLEYTMMDYISILQGKVENQKELGESECDFLNGYLEMKKHLKLETVNKALHEMIGIKMLDEILPDSNLKGFQRLCRSIAKQMLTRQDQDPVLETLYEIVSGELDADRLDYSLRDPYSSGLELGQIDMERLLNNFTVVKEKDKYRILPKVQALSTIETFYHNRYLSYKYLIYHHSKVRMDQIVREIAFQLLNVYLNDNKNRAWINDILEKNNFNFLWSKINKNLPVDNRGDNDYYYCDEGWFNSLIKEVYFKSKEHSHVDKEIRSLLLMIETFIFRRTENIISLFKRYDKYLNFFDIIRNKIEEEIGGDTKLEEKEFIKYCMGLISDGVFEDFKEIVKEKYDITFLMKTTSPKSMDFDNEGNSKLKIVVGSKKEVMPIQRVSPYLESLKFMHDSDQLFHIFLIGDNIKNKVIWKQIEPELHIFIKDKYLKEN